MHDGCWIPPFYSSSNVWEEETRNIIETRNRPQISPDLPRSPQIKMNAISNLRKIYHYFLTTQKHIIKNNYYGGRIKTINHSFLLSNFLSSLFLITLSTTKIHAVEELYTSVQLCILTSDSEKVIGADVLFSRT